MTTKHSNQVTEEQKAPAALAAPIWLGLLIRRPLSFGVPVFLHFCVEPVIFRLRVFRLQLRKFLLECRIFFYECDLIRRRCCVSSYFLTNRKELSFYFRVWGFPDKPNYMFKMFNYIHSVLWPNDQAHRLPDPKTKG